MSDVHGSKATTKRIFLGRGVKYFKNISVGEFQMETHTLEKGDEIMITGPTTGIVKHVIEEMRVADQSVDKVKRETTSLSNSRRSFVHQTSSTRSSLLNV